MSVGYCVGQSEPATCRALLQQNERKIAMDMLDVFARLPGLRYFHDILLLEETVVITENHLLPLCRDFGQSWFLESTDILLPGSQLLYPTIGPMVSGIFSYLA